MVATSTIPVDPGNLDQLRAWDGDEGGYWAANADAFERGIAGFDTAFLDAAAIGAADRVLDIGCGTGGTSLAAARRAPAGAVLGVDLSSAMLAVARRRAEEQGVRNVEFLQADAQIHRFDAAAFDAAISRTAAMFFADRVSALANIGRALLPGGRLVLLVWQPPPRNEWFLELTGALAAGRELPPPPPDAPHPFTLADPAVARDVVAAAGYTDVMVDGLNGVMDLGPDPRGAFDLMVGLLGWMLHGLDDDGRVRALDALRRTIERHSGPDGVRFGAAVWLISARHLGTSPQ
jgi:SAM-dependent methyltransferase